MRLHFLRHATAQDVAASDAARELTREGREEARIAGQALARLGCQPAQILTSPLVRARQTAELAAQELKFAGEIIVSDELRNEATSAGLLRSLRRYFEAHELVLVGHMPSLADHVLWLIGAETAPGLALGKGGLATVETTELRAGAGSLRCLLRQKQLRALVS